MPAVAPTRPLPPTAWKLVRRECLGCFSILPIVADFIARTGDESTAASLRWKNLGKIRGVIKCVRCYVGLKV